jgi:squalene synthase HpnC
VVSAELERAYDWCGDLARSHYENFPVASRLLPASMRPHIAAIYAFARLADDMADEGNRSSPDRLADLDRWEARLVSAVRGDAVPPGPRAEVFVALQHSITACGLPPQLLHDLLSAFKQDVNVTRYQGWDDLLDYCRRSANPVGRLVLRVAGCASPELDAASDALCTALQLTNFWQDLELDWAKGRIYVPAAIRQATGALDMDLSARQLTPAWRAALADVSARTRALFERGARVGDEVPGRLGWELRATWLGGSRILDKIERAGYDVLGARPTLGAADAPSILWRMLAWRSH